MGNLNYKIIATGNIRLHEVKRSKTAKISPRKKIAIEKIWQDSLRKKGGKLFNGFLLNFAALRIRGNIINLSGNFVEYKQLIADRKRPELNLNIMPIGVSGMIIVKERGVDYVVFAKRSDWVTTYPNFFELVPSGSIDKKCILENGDIDYKAKLLSEFSEETGLPKNYVKQISGFALVLDKTKNIYDVCCIILVNKDRATITKSFAKSEEYKNPEFIPLKNLDTFIKTEAISIVPTSIAMLKAFSKLS